MPLDIWAFPQFELPGFLLYLCNFKMWKRQYNLKKWIFSFNLQTSEKFLEITEVRYFIGLEMGIIV